MNEVPNENPSSMPDETDIRDALKDVIEQVENMFCSVSIDINSTPAACSSRISEVSLHSSDRSNHSTPKTEKSKHRSGNKKNRLRCRKRKWKPYDKMTANERNRVNERNSRKKNRSLEKMSLSGLALAPYNTTQFIMDDQNFKLSDSDMHSPERRIKEDFNSSDSDSSLDDETVFIQRQFSEEYDSYYEAHLNNMSKHDLVLESIGLEDKIEIMEQELKNIVDIEMKIDVFQVEIQKLIDENYELEQKNEELQKHLMLLNTVM